MSEITTEEMIEYMEASVSPMTSSLQEHAICSIAISVKRIADAVTGDDKNTGIHKAILDIAGRETVSAFEQVFGS